MARWAFFPAATTTMTFGTILISMRLARVLGAIGRALISAGVIVLLFVGYQLWGTGLQHSAAQGDLEDDFIEAVESSDLAAEAELVQEQFKEIQEAAAEEQGVPIADAEVVEFDFSEISDEFIGALYPEPGKSLARILIPDIGVDQIIVEGVSVEDLRKGPGHYATTPNPGQAGNAAVAGHRTTYGAPFHRVDELQPGAIITVSTVQGTFEYRVKENVAPDGSVKGYFIVSPSDTWVLGQDTGENLLTLTACHPKYSARQRIIVQAELVGTPAPTIPRSEASEFAPVSLDSGAADETAGSAEAVAADNEVVMSDEVAADDDPSVDADGNPLTCADCEPGTDGAVNADASDLENDLADEIDDADGVAAAEDVATTPDPEADVALEDSNEFELTAAQSPLGDPDDFGEGLNGDSTKVRPAIMWGLAAGSIWMAAWFIGTRLNRKWTLYVVGFAPFALVLWSCFVNVDQALPSY